MLVFINNPKQIDYDSISTEIYNSIHSSSIIREFDENSAGNPAALRPHEQPFGQTRKRWLSLVGERIV